MSTQEEIIADLIGRLEVALQSVTDQTDVGRILIERFETDIVATNQRIDSHDIALGDKAFHGHGHTPDQVGLRDIPTVVSHSPTTNSRDSLPSSEALYAVHSKTLDNATAVQDKADKSYVDTLNGTKVSQGYVDAALSNKAGQSETALALAYKADKDWATAALNNKADLVDGMVPTSQLPGYVDRVVAYSVFGNFPITGDDGTIYLAQDTGITYRWAGTVYAPIGSDVALGETSATAYRGDRGKIAYDHSQLAHVPLDNPIFTGYIGLNGGKHRITENDGGGNFNIRVGCRFDSDASQLVATEGGWPVAITCTNDNADGRFEVRICPDLVNEGEYFSLPDRAFSVNALGQVTGLCVADSVQALDTDDLYHLMTPKRTAAAIADATATALSLKADKVGGRLPVAQLPSETANAITSLTASVNGHTTTLANKADLVAGKVPSTQLPDIGGVPVGTIMFLPFRPNELPDGWYFANGDRYGIHIEPGITLMYLSTAFKADWAMIVSGSTINVPNMFHTDGRGVYLRGSANGSILPGYLYVDAYAAHWHGTYGSESGFRHPVMAGVDAHIDWYSERASANDATYNASSRTDVSGWSGETRPLSKAMTPAIYLGV